MGTFIKVSDAVFDFYSANLSPLPYADLAESFHLFGGDAETSLRNLLVKPEDDLSAVLGVPTYDEGYANFNCAANGITSGIAGHSPFTTVIVATGITGSDARGYAGNWSESPAVYRNLLFLGVNIQISVDGGGKAPVAFVPDNAVFTFMAATHSGTEAKTYVHNGSELLSASQSFSGGDGSLTAFRVGGHGLGTGAFKCAAAVRYPLVLSEAQIEEVRVFLTGLLQKRGIDVL